jgi:transposase
MDPREIALFSHVFHLPAEITITSVDPSPTELVMGVACQAPRMECPECHQLSARMHGSYQRTVADLPCAGRNVMLALSVRKFVCGTPTCPRKIFTERLPGLVESYARMTSRLIALVQALGLVAGGQMGTRQADRTGIATSPSILLRHLMQLPAPVTRAVRVLGIDDFAWKKRFTYGTILVDLERRKIIDVLPDRESATVETWLKEHPEVDVVSRDRGKEFTKAATLAAPQARASWWTGSIWFATWQRPFRKSLRTVVLRSVRKTLISCCHKRQQRTLLIRFPLQQPGNNARHLISKLPIKHAKPAAMIGFVR